MVAQYCTGCGNRLSAKAGFCPKCGKIANVQKSQDKLDAKGGEIPIVIAVTTVTVAVTLFIVVLAMLINMIFTPTSRPYGQPIGSNVVHHVLPRFVPPTTSDSKHYVPNGKWQVEAPTYNDEIITIEFIDDTFLMITETSIADADIAVVMETLYEIQEFYIRQGSDVEIYRNAEDNVLLRVTMEGTFILTENELWLIGRGDTLTVLPFSWDEYSMTINNNRFIQALGTQTEP